MEASAEMARTYKRDSNGRFAGGGGGSGGGRRSTPKPRTLPKTTTAKGRARTLETSARSAVKAGGGARAARSLATAQRARDWYKATGGGTKRSATKPRSGIRRTGGLPRPVAGNSVKRTTGPRRAPLARRMNAIRTYEPKTPGGQMAKGLRRIDRAVRGVEGDLKKIKGAKKQASSIMNRIARSTARTMIESQQKGVLGDVARTIMRGESGKMQRVARDVIRRRAGRAAAAAARGSKPAARAMAIYDRQLAPVLSGKPGKRAGNTIKPGPRNANPPKKKPRKPRTPKPPGSPKPKRKPKR